MLKPVNKKIIGILICSLLLISISVLPATSTPSNEFFISKTVEEKDNIIIDKTPTIGRSLDDLYESLTNKILNNEKPRSEIRRIYSFKEIKDKFNEIYDDETNDVLNLFIKKIRPVQKRITPYNYLEYIKDECNKDSIQDLELNLETFSEEIQSIEDLESSTLFPKLNTNMDTIYQLYTEWNEFILDYPTFQKVLLILDMDPEQAFLLGFVIWIFLNAGAALVFTDTFILTIMIIEAIGLGVIATIGTFLLFKMLSHPLLENLHDRITNSEFLSNNFPDLQLHLLNLTNSMLEFFTYDNFVAQAVTAILISEIVVGTFLVIFPYVFFKFLFTGVWFEIPFIAWTIYKIIFLPAESETSYCFGKI